MISLNSHGADTLRLYEMFMGPLDGFDCMVRQMGLMVHVVS